MFQVGDLVMYGGTGVCRVKDMTETDFDGRITETLYYILEPIYQSGLIYVPADNQKVFMRPVISREEAIRLIDSMPETDSKVFRSSSTQQLSKHYQEVIQSHDTTELIRMTKSIHKKKRNALKQNRRLGQIDKKYMKLAEDLLFGELACALDIPRDQVESYIEDRLGKDPLK